MNTLYIRDLIIAVIFCSLTSPESKTLGESLELS